MLASTPYNTYKCSIFVTYNTYKCSIFVTYNTDKISYLQSSQFLFSTIPTVSLYNT